MSRPAKTVPSVRPPQRPLRHEGDLRRSIRGRRFLRRSLAESGAPPPPARPSLVSSAHGAIHSLLSAVPGWVAENPRYSCNHREIYTRLPETCEIVILTHERTAGRVSSWPEVRQHPGGAKVVTVRDHIAFTEWCEDPYVVCRDLDGSRHYLVEPHEFLRGADALVADEVARHTELHLAGTVLYFQGGNLLIADDFFLIGADYPTRTRGYIPDVISPPEGADKDMFVRELFKSYLDADRELIEVASSVEVPSERWVLREREGSVWVDHLYAGNTVGTTQPLFHIDMFVTLAGRGEDGRYRLFVGDPTSAAEVLGQDLPDHALNKAFNSVADGFDPEHFDVRRNPLPYTLHTDRQGLAYFRERDPDLAGELEKRAISEIEVDHWYYATSNNALVQISETHGNVVWLPTYGEDFLSTDEANRQLWIDLGFEARLLGDFHAYAQALGALHCVTKYLARE